MESVGIPTLGTFAASKVERMSTVTLPRLRWGPADAARRALLVHGLGSSAHTQWRLGEALAERGWSATAVDLRGHGDAPRASRYRIDDLADDLLATRPDAATVSGVAVWDLVIGHSIGGAAVAQAGALDVGWARRLVLLDPAIVLDEAGRETVLAGQLANHDGATVAGIAADFPHWHPLDVEFRVRAAKDASRFALERMVRDNDDWDVRAHVARLAMPTLVIAADPAHGAMFAGALADEVLTGNPRVSAVVITGAGHSVHRDDPAATLRHLLAFADD